MKRKHGEASFNLALNWNTVLQATWDDERDIPDLIVRSPGETYPVMKRSGNEVAYTFFRWEEDIDTLAERYPQAKDLLTRKRLGQSFTHNIEVIEYVDHEERLLILGGDVKSLLPKEGGKHKLGKCPVVIVSAVYVPGVPFPPGPIDQAVGMVDHLNRFQTKLSEAIEETCSAGTISSVGGLRRGGQHRTRRSTATTIPTSGTTTRSPTRAARSLRACGPRAALRAKPRQRPIGQWSDAGIHHDRQGHHSASRHHARAAAETQANLGAGFRA
jgi:hypothetical protein